MLGPAVLLGVPAALPSVSSAQGVTFDGLVPLGYGFNSVDGLGTDSAVTGGSPDFSGLPNHIDVDLLSLSVELDYRFGNDAWVGAYYRMGALDVALLGPMTVGIDTSHYGVFGGYDFGHGRLEAFSGTSEIAENSPLGAEFPDDVLDCGLSCAYQVTPELKLYRLSAHWLRPERADGPRLIPLWRCRV